VVILVTGGAGFVGSAVVDRLVAGGHEVRVVDLLHPGAHAEVPPYLSPGAEYRWGDLADADTAQAAVAGVDAVCHQAAMVGLGVDFADVTDYAHHNVVATAQLLRALHDRAFRGRIVLASSMVVYGEGAYRCRAHGPVQPSPRRADDLARGNFDPRCPECDRVLDVVRIDEPAPVDPRSVYAATKLHQEHLCATYGREHDAPVLALRYHNVYGPRMPASSPYSGVAAIFRSACEEGRAPLVFEDGGQQRDFVHVDDVAVANVLALTAPHEVTGACNVASGEAHTVLDLATELVAAIPGAPAPEVCGRWRSSDVRHVLASTARAAEVLGFRSAVGFREGMAAFAVAPLRAAVGTAAATAAGTAVGTVRSGGVDDSVPSRP
jgi:dTDP-L-rhamnose 4-epimerase